MKNTTDNLMVPFNPSTGEIYWGWCPTQRELISHRPNTPFSATLFILKVESTYSGSATVILRDEEGIDYIMYASEFNKIAHKLLEGQGKVSGVWQIKRKSQHRLTLTPVK